VAAEYEEIVCDATYSHDTSPKSREIAQLALLQVGHLSVRTAGPTRVDLPPLRLRLMSTVATTLHPTVRPLSRSMPPMSSMPIHGIELHARQQVRWAHVATVCFICFSFMLHVFHLDVAKVDLVLHMLQ
jgi:hypothetical protein